MLEFATHLFQHIRELVVENPWAQLFGLVAIVIAFLGYQCRKRIGIIMMLAAASFFWAIQFALLGSPAGIFMNLLCIPRNIIFAKRGLSRWATSPFWLYLFLVIAAASGAWSMFVQQEGWPALLSTGGQLLSTYAFYITNERRIRIISIFVSLFWLFYDAISGSIPGTICEVFNQVSLYIALFRYRRQKAEDNI